MNRRIRKSEMDPDEALPWRSPMFWWFSGWQFLVDWARSRYPRALVVGLLTLVVTLAAVLVGVAAANLPKDDLKLRYRQHADTALKEKDYATAELLLDKLVLIGDSDPVIQYATALAAAESADLDRAERIMTRLASERSDYAPAHLWLAQHLLSQLGPQPDVEAYRPIRQHLGRVVAVQPDNAEAWIRLGQIAALTERWGEAIEYFTKASAIQPEQKLQVARLYAARGNTAAAAKLATEMIQEFNKQLRDNAGDTSARLSVAAAYDFLEKWKEAEAVLRDGLGGSDDERLKAAIIDHYCRVSDYLLQPGQSSLPLCVETLRLAYRTDPKHRGSLARIAKLVAMDVKLPVEMLTDAVAFLREEIEKNPSSWELNLGLARGYLQQGKVGDAQRILTPLAEQRPEAAVVLAQLLLSQNETAASLRTADAALRKLEAQLTGGKEPEDITRLLLWAELTVFAGKWEEAESRLRREFERTNALPLRQGLGSLYLSWAERKADEELEKRLERLVMALELLPDHRMALGALVRMAEANPADRVKSIELIQQLLVRSKQPAAIHYALGTIYSISEQWQEAVFHLEQAQRVYASDITLMNNLAWALAQAEGDEASLQRAAQLAEATVQSAPGSIECIETRGVIALKRKQWPQAIADLERVLKELPTRYQLHEQLAEAYEGQGNPSIAKLHREQAAKARSAATNQP